MLDLRTLGGLDIASTGPLGKAASQPRRLALLAVLAEASERGVSRDALIGLLWPEQIAESARHNLTQTLYALRRDLGAEDLFTGTSRLALNPTLLGCDLWKFRRALQENDWDAAVKLYRGPFLSGVFINHTPEFDRWVEQARQNIAAEYARGIELLAGDLAARGEHAQAAALWRRLASFDPHNASVVMEIARQMRAAGDRAGALSIIHEFGTRLREDLALPLDAALIQLADSIRGELGHRPPPVVGQQVAAFHPDRASGAQEVRRGHPIHLSPLRRKRQLLVLAAGGLAVATVLVVSAGRNRPISSPSGTTSVAVLPFEVHGDSAAGFLRDGMARLVAQGLDGVGRVRAALYPTVGPLLDRAESAADTSGAMGRRFRIDRYVAGDVTLVGTTIQVRAVLHDVSKRGATLGTALVTGSRDSLFGIAETITRRLLGIEPTQGSSELVRKASETTRSQEAFKAFVEGEGLFRASRYADAVAAYQQAVREDTTFALAYYRLAEALDWNAQGPQIPPVTAAALRFADRLPWRERRLLEGSTAWRNGRNDEAESSFQQITSRYPNDAEAWFQLAEVLFHSNAIRGRVFLESEAPFRRVIALDPESRGALTHLGRIRVFLGDSSGADSLFRAAEALMPGGPDVELALFHAMTTGHRAARAAALERLSLEKTYLVTVAAYRLAAYARDLPAADTVLRRSMRIGLSVNDLNQVRYWVVVIAAAQGQLARALKETDILKETDPGEALELRGLLATLPYAPYTEQERLTTVTQLRNAGGGPDPHAFLTRKERLGSLPRWYLLGLLSWRNRDVAGLNRYADSLEKAPPSLGGQRAAASFAAALRSFRTALTGTPEEAVAALARVPEPGEASEHIIGALLNERFLRAALLERLDRGEEALGYYSSLVFGNPNSILFAIPAVLQRARLLVHLGRTDEARRDYQTVLEAWRQADAALQPILDSARAELSRLH